MGNSVLVEENGTTDYAGVVLRCFAAEGVCQGHGVVVVGMPKGWGGKGLPGLVGDERVKKKGPGEKRERMKIAWRYERDTAAESWENEEKDKEGEPFCHTFDLNKPLVYPVDARVDFLPLDTTTTAHPDRSPFETVMEKLSGLLEAGDDDDAVYRIVVPSLLSPALYPPHASRPEYVLRFLHGLRTLLAKYQDRVTAMLSLPLDLYPRSSGLTRWMEILSDGVMELTPFPHASSTADVLVVDQPSSSTTSTEEELQQQPQGLLRVHRLPIFHERYSGTLGEVDQWTFTLSRRKFTIRPYSLPPADGDTEAQQSAVKDAAGQKKKSDIDF